MPTFSRRVAHATCAQVIHPWSDDCSRAYRMMIRSSATGSCKLLVPIILVDYALRLRKKKQITKEMARELLNDFIQSVAVGTCISTSMLVNSCILRYLMGRYTYTSVVFFPGFFAGFSYVILKPKRKLQLFTAFANAALESVLLKMSHSGLLTLNVYTETVFFMVTNAYLMYLSRKFKPNHSNYTWFYKPEAYGLAVGGKSYLETIYKKTRNYFGLGVGFGVLSTLIGDVTVLAPKNLHKLFKTKTLKPGIFAGSYVAAYELTVYFLNRHFREDRSVYALPAGFLAGMSYAIEPNLSINLSAFINLIQLLCKLIDVRSLKHVSADTILFCLFTGILFHIQLFYPKSVSKVGSKIIRASTENRSNMIVEGVKKLVCSAF